MTLHEIWQIDDKENLIVELSQYIAEKCGYGESMDALSTHERVFYVTQTLEMEVNNGGFSQFFYNSSGDFAGELIQAFTDIGAFRTAEICGEALGAFGCKLPENQDARQEMLDALESEEIDGMLGECDDAFYEYQDDLSGLNYDYVMKHKASFT
ncbi:MAG: DMP19 family protein [Clostridia bacterium]|nr:DMP19 family protein [Clostridia bacterium]